MTQPPNLRIVTEDQHTWDELDGKPSTFPPSSHRHDWSEIDGTPTTYPPSSHRHDWDEIDDKPASYPPSTHSHPISEVTGLQAKIDRVDAAPATWYWDGTSLPTSAAQVHAQARVGDFIVAPNLTTDPGWHQITGV